ncbi:3-oxoacid CoA-transferase subunit B [Ruminococcaceae bacterium OttesenSCG-928-O06]|nr:3-oxoacid CoA-transferase subunit B [Ruminococcaceae bacterium OttesenSCG-928-O06]
MTFDKDNVKGFIAARVAQELNDGDVVNLGIGLPTMIPSYLPEGVELTMEAENGIIGSIKPDADHPAEPYWSVDAGGQAALAGLGGAYIDSAVSFGLIRGGHIDATVLGTLEVDQEGNLSNWIIPGKRLPGMGGAMDLVVGAKKVIVATEHTAKGKPKILKKCTLPFTAINCVDMIVTEMCVFVITPDGMVMTEYNPAFTLDEIKAATEADYTVADDVKEMVVNF